MTSYMYYMYIYMHIYIYIYIYIYILGKGKWPSVLRYYIQRKVTGSNPNRCLAWLWDPTSLQTTR